MIFKWITVTQKMIDDLRSKHTDLDQPRNSLFGTFYYEVGLVMAHVMIVSTEALTIKVLLKEEEERFIQFHEYIGCPDGKLPRFKKKFSCKEFDE